MIKIEDILEDIIDIQKMDVENFIKLSRAVKIQQDIIDLLIERVGRLERRKTSHTRWW